MDPKKAVFEVHESGEELLRLSNGAYHIVTKLSAHQVIKLLEKYQLTHVVVQDEYGGDVRYGDAIRPGEYTVVDFATKLLLIEARVRAC